MVDRFSSIDCYRILETIAKKLEALPIRSTDKQFAPAYVDLTSYVRTELTACAIRAAHAKAESRRRQRTTEKENTSEL